MSEFIAFPDHESILAALGSLEGASLASPVLNQAIADRLASRVYDGAAFTFILMELLHEHQAELEAGPRALLPHYVKALTADQGLAASAQRAFDEILELIS